MNFDFDWRQHVRDHPRFGGYYRVVDGKPGWVVRAALIATALVIVVPVVLITLAALTVGVTVFVVLGLVAKLLHTIRVWTGAVPRPTRDTPATREQPTRENVRVIRP